MRGRQVGRSEPAFCVARTTALPPPTGTARQEAGQLHLLAVVLLRCLYQPDRLQLFFKACAGRIVCRPCLPAAALFSRLCLPVHLCHPCLLPSSSFAPFCFDFPPPPPPPCSFPCAPGSSQELQGLSCWQLQHGPAVAARAPVDSLPFSCRVYRSWAMV